MMIRSAALRSSARMRPILRLARSAGSLRWPAPWSAPPSATRWSGSARRATRTWKSRRSVTEIHYLGCAIAHRWQWLESRSHIERAPYQCAARHETALGQQSEAEAAVARQADQFEG